MYNKPGLIRYIIDKIKMSFEVIQKCRLCQCCLGFNRSAHRATSAKGSLMRRLNSAPVPGSPADSSPYHSAQDVDKENSRSRPLISPIKPPMDSVSPPGAPVVLFSPLRSKVPLESHDSNSRDSGFAQDDSQQCIRFVEPSGFAPRRLDLSPKKTKMTESPVTKANVSGSNLKSVSEDTVTGLSFCSTESSDDGFLELGDLDKSFTNENSSANLPVGMDRLLSAPIHNLNDTLPADDAKKSDAEDTDEDVVKLSSRLPLRRVHSLFENYNSPASSKARIGLFRDDSTILSPVGDASPFEKLSCKRTREMENNAAKRRKFSAYGGYPGAGSEHLTRNPRYKLQRSISETAAFSLASAMHKSDLIADFSRPYALPVISGRHEDLKSISSETLADLINGNYSNTINSFRIIDCRYPYEYEGGHIKGSINLYTKEQVQQELLDSIPPPPSPKESGGGSVTADRRNILIFHCEFSLERGPTLYRHLRRCDRNVSSYPSLQYPEVYLLHGGYQSFFASHKSLCEPCSYQPMVDPKHEHDLKKFRIKSNSWSGDVKRRGDRTSLKRLELF